VTRIDHSGKARLETSQGTLSRRQGDRHRADHLIPDESILFHPALASESLCARGLPRRLCRTMWLALAEPESLPNQKDAICARTMRTATARFIWRPFGQAASKAFSSPLWQ